MPAAAPPAPITAAAAVAPLAGTAQARLSQARTGYAALHEQGEVWGRTISASLSAASRGVTELNGKVLDLVRMQTDSTLDLWRQLLGVHSFAEAVELQTREMRRQFETTSSHLKDIAQTSNRILNEAFQNSRLPPSA